jgi:hypothetical protein
MRSPYFASGKLVGIVPTERVRDEISQRERVVGESGASHGSLPYWAEAGEGRA